MHHRLWDHPFMTAGFVVVVLVPMFLAIGIWATPKHGSSTSATPDVVMAANMRIPSVGSSLGDVLAYPAHPMTGSSADRKPLTGDTPTPFVRPLLGNKGVHSLNGNVNNSACTLNGHSTRKPPTFKFPCKTCGKPVKSNQHGIFCDGCEL